VQLITNTEIGIERVQACTRWHFAFALCCHSNATRAPIANPPNSAQLGASHTTPPTYIRVRAVVWACGRGQTGAQTDARDHNIHFASSTTHAKCNYDWWRVRSWRWQRRQRSVHGVDDDRPTSVNETWDTSRHLATTAASAGTTAAPRLVFASRVLARVERNVNTNSDTTAVFRWQTNTRWTASQYEGLLSFRYFVVREFVTFGFKIR